MECIVCHSEIIIESIWFYRLILQLCPRVSFPCRNIFIEKIILALVNKTLVKYV
jgi:hypothetical protein